MAHMPPISVLPADSEVGPSGNHDHRPLAQQKRMVKRFRRRPLAVDFWQPDAATNDSSAVSHIKVGNNSESGADSVTSRLSGSSGATSIPASWRHSLNSLLDRLSIPSRHSTTSGATLVYEELELPQTIPELYRSVISVGSQCHKNNSTVVSVSPEEAPALVSTLHDAEENINELADTTVTSVTVDDVQRAQTVSGPEPQLNSLDSNANVASHSCQTEHAGSGENERHPRRRLPETPPDHIRFMPHHPAHFAPPYFDMSGGGPGPHRFAGPPPHPHHIIPPGFAPWNAASSPIELTGWRINSSFDPAPGDPDAVVDSRRAHNNHEPTLIHTGNLLVPEDLPHLLPDAGFTVPFARYEEHDYDSVSGKDCCSWFSIDQETVLKSFIGVICLVGIACVLVGIVLGAVTVSGTTRLTLCLLLIGVGAVLLTVSAIAFRLTSVDPTARSSLLGFLGFRPASPTTLHSTNNPYYRVRSDHMPNLHQHAANGFDSGAYFPEFNWRPPPPSYQASVRDATLQQLFGLHTVAPVPGVMHASGGSPPPTYRSNVEASHRPALHQIISSGPPSYRSHDGGSGLPVTVEEPAQNATNNSATAATDDTNQDHLVDMSDRRRLIHEQNDRTENDETVGGDRVNVIDCSTAVPFTFEVPPNAENGHNSRQQAVQTTASRRRQHARGQPPPPFVEVGPHLFAPHPLPPLRPLCFVREGPPPMGPPRRYPSGVRPVRHPPQMGVRIRPQIRTTDGAQAQGQQNRQPNPQQRGTTYV